MPAPEIAAAQMAHLPQLLALYQQAAQDPAGLIRLPAEVDEPYVGGFLANARQHGLSLVALDGQRVVGEIHAYTPPLFAFQHLLTDLTIVVAPAYQGQGLGRQLFTTFLATVQQRFRHILRVELYVRETNVRNVQFYESLGFVNEGRQDRKIFAGQGQFETPQHMAWFNPQYDSTT
jgi:ribosomal protein S18 acetylase RimI-like enzyme